MIRYRFLCESLSKKNTYNSKVEIQETLKETYHFPIISPTKALEDKPLTCHRRFFSPSPTAPPLKPPDSPLLTSRLESTPIRYTINSENCDGLSNVNLTTIPITPTTTTIIDERLHRHLWNANRVIAWCGDFPDDYPPNQKHDSNINKSHNNIQEKILSSPKKLGNSEQVAAGRLDLLQHSKYEKAMYSISPRHLLRKDNQFISPQKSQQNANENNSPSRPSSPYQTNQLLPNQPASPRPLSASNPRKVWEQKHREKIDEMREKKSEIKKEFEEKKLLIKENKEKNNEKIKNDEKEGKIKCNKWKEKRSHRAHIETAKKYEEGLKIIEDKNIKIKQIINEKREKVKKQKQRKTYFNEMNKDINEVSAIISSINRHESQYHQNERKKEKVELNKIQRKYDQLFQSNSNNLTKIQEISDEEEHPITNQESEIISPTDTDRLSSTAYLRHFISKQHSKENKQPKKIPQSSEITDDILSDDGSIKNRNNVLSTSGVNSTQHIRMKFLSDNNTDDETNTINLESPRRSNKKNLYK